MNNLHLGKYEILETLGAGSTADVYRARDTVLGREVAVKILKPALLSDPAVFDRFKREAQSAAGLFHPHIATVLDMDTSEGRYFIVMRYIPGQALDKRLQQSGPLPWKMVLRLAEQIGAALSVAHAAGVLHRDVKPGNIICTPQNDFVLTDFGLARALETSGMTNPTGALIGTPAYMPPELWEGQAPSPVTDEYALACVIYEAVTGQVLFEGQTSPAIMARHFKEIPLPSVWPDGIPQGLGPVLRRALAKTREERYPAIDAFIQALAGLELPAEGGLRPPDTAARDEAARQAAAEKMRRAAEALPPKAPGPISISGERSERSGRMTILLAENIPMEFVRVPAGEFLMGGDKRKDPLAIEDELPQHKVYLSDYWIGSCPVTVAQFSAFIKTSGYRCQAETNPSLEDHPVTNVAWNDANAFCNWVTRLTQASGRQACMIRLPTEAEWENAARGTDGCLYPWGNQAPDASLCNYDDQVGMTTPVGLYSPQGNSTYGCVDLAGNVWEWTQDWYDAAYYQHSTATNPAGPDSGQYRVLRGGSWHNNDRSVRAAHRSRRTPNGRENNIGFRCVASSL